MSFREPFPILYVRDVAASERFYCETLGFERAFRWPAEGDELEFVFLRLDPLGIGLGRRDDAVWGGDFELCIYADDADAAAERLRANGARELRAPQDEPWGERRTYFADPDGHTIHIAAKL